MSKIINRIINVLTAVAVLFALALVILAAPSFFDPQFEVVNNSPEAVSVVATWRSHEKEMGAIQPLSSYAFSINDEAAIRFKVRYSSGKEIESEPLYFTNGTKVIATISSKGIELRYGFET